MSERFYAICKKCDSTISRPDAPGTQGAEWLCWCCDEPLKDDKYLPVEVFVAQLRAELLDMTARADRIKAAGDYLALQARRWLHYKGASMEPYSPSYVRDKLHTAIQSWTELAQGGKEAQVQP